MITIIIITFPLPGVRPVATRNTPRCTFFVVAAEARQKMAAGAAAVGGLLVGASPPLVSWVAAKSRQWLRMQRWPRECGGVVAANAAVAAVCGGVVAANAAVAAVCGGVVAANAAVAAVCGGVVAASAAEVTNGRGRGRFRAAGAGSRLVASCRGLPSPRRWGPGYGSCSLS
jgi:hypothetical protein